MTTSSYDRKKNVGVDRKTFNQKVFYNIYDWHNIPQDLVKCES